MLSKVTNAWHRAGVPRWPALWGHWEPCSCEQKSSFFWVFISILPAVCFESGPTLRTGQGGMCRPFPQPVCSGPCGDSHGCKHRRVHTTGPSGSLWRWEAVPGNRVSLMNMVLSLRRQTPGYDSVYVMFS